MITKNEISSLNLSPTKKDFVQIWNELIEVASKITERWDPTSTNESDPGIVLLKVLAGIADKLNYNIDKNILEAYMPTAAQLESMRKLCEMAGYDIKYYQSAATKVRISYTGNTTDTSEDNDEKLPAMGLALPKFTTITNADKDITFVTTNKLPALFTNATPWVEVSCIEGQISQCESVNDNNLINLSQLDANNRYYLPEIQIAENGIFVYNATASLTDGTAWTQVTNLNTQSSGSRVYKFGYDSIEGRPYLAFPTDIGSLIEDGLFIYFVRTSGINGNISPNTLKALEIPAGEAWGDYSAEQFEVVNTEATSNGANIESISAAYNNFKKTVGTFDTLVTCRDYMNKIYSLMDANNSPYVSNILVTDIRNDINSAITLCSCNEFGILYKETPLTKKTGDVYNDCSTSSVKYLDSSDTYQLVIQPNVHETTVPKIDHFDLVLYPFKTFTKVSQGTSDLVLPYNKSFTYTEKMNREIDAAVSEFKTCAHNFITPAEGDIVAINNYLRLNALIATSTRVSEIEAETILHNVKVALVNEFNLRNLDFGEEIPFDSILSVIENADSRIKAVSLQEPTVLTTYSVKEGDTSVEYGIVATSGDIKGEKVKGVDYDSAKAKEIYNKLVLRNILAGRAELFEYDNDFVSNNSEKPYTITKNITADLYDENVDQELAAKIKAEMASYTTPGEHVLTEPGFNGGVVTLRVVADESDLTYNTDVQYEVYETYEPAFVEAVKNIDDIARIEATCEISKSGLSSSTFKDITLAQNEVVRFRAPNLITTKTFPAYVYYNFERAEETSNDDGSTASDGRYAEVESLLSFIQAYGEAKFFKGLWQTAFNKSRLEDFTAEITIKKENGEPVIITESAIISQNKIQDVFSKAIACGIATETKNSKGTVIAVDFLDSNIFASRTAFDSFLATKVEELANSLANGATGTLTIEFKYCTLDASTMDTVWGPYVRSCYKESMAITLPGDTTFWKLASTGSHPRGKFVTRSGQRLYAQDGDTLLYGNVGESTYICTDLGADPIYRSITENSDVELRPGDKLFIHYTPSSTNEDGETVSADPVSIVYEGGNTEDPIILKPSGFTLIPSQDLVQQGTSWKKTDVEFVGYGQKNLLALAPNEQIELRSISRVVLNSPARLFKNFDNAVLEDRYNNEVRTYELKDGEYLFYTDQNTNEAAYYGSGSVLTLDKHAYIPKAQESIEISQILEQGLSIVPWSAEVPLSTNRKITITEYQYVTLVDGDTINTLTLETNAKDATGNYMISSARRVKAKDTNGNDLTDEDGNIVTVNDPWVKCLSTDIDPIAYTFAGTDTPTKLPRMDIYSGPSTSWEVCSFLELSTSPGYSQSLRAISVPQEGSSPVSVVDKLAVYPNYGTSIGAPVTIIPQATSIPASNDEKFEPVSFKLNTVAQVASGNFIKPEDDDTDDNDEATDTSKLKIKVFSEESPMLLNLTDFDANITPISLKYVGSDTVTSFTAATTSSINNYWSAVDITHSLASSEQPKALNMNFMIPDNDMFGIFSIYVATNDENIGNQEVLNSGSRLFIDLPEEYSLYSDVISIYNYEKTVDDTTYHWWEESFTSGLQTRRLYLRAGLNCIKIVKSCNLLIKAEADAVGTLLYDSMRLVKGIAKQGINLKLLDYRPVDATTESEIAEALLNDIAALDEKHEFYYNAPIENSLAIEFDKNISSFFNPYTLYDVNNINNDFVISKLDVKYLDTGLKIAKSSKY